MSKPTKQQWEDFEQKSLQIYSSQKLICDGFALTVRREAISATKLGLIVYVNGELRGAWLGNESQEHPEHRFMRRCERYVWPLKFRKSMLKILGKKDYAKEAYDKKLISYNFYWNNAADLRRHLSKVCTCITIEAMDAGIVLAPMTVELAIGSEQP